MSVRIVVNCDGVKCTDFFYLGDELSYLSELLVEEGWYGDDLKQFCEECHNKEQDKIV